MMIRYHHVSTEHFGPPGAQRKDEEEEAERLEKLQATKEEITKLELHLWVVKMLKLLM